MTNSRKDTQRDVSELARLRNEPPDEFGIRRGLVARVRAMIESGEYETPERWAYTEEALLRELEESL